MLSIWCCACSLLQVERSLKGDPFQVVCKNRFQVPGVGIPDWSIGRLRVLKSVPWVLRCFQFKAKSSESELFKPQRSPQQPHSPAIWPNQQIFKLTLIVLISTCSSSAMSMFFLASSSAFFLAAILAAFLSAFFCFLCRRTWWYWLLEWGWRCPGDRVLPCY